MDYFQAMIDFKAKWDQSEKLQNERVKLVLQEFGKEVRETLLHELPDRHQVRTPHRHAGGNARLHEVRAHAWHTCTLFLRSSA